jgi:predicted GNAT family N-acyltransferase
MSTSTRSEFIDLVNPLLGRVKLYDPTKPPGDQPKNDAADPAKAIPQGFIDAMIVREAVFVKEQGVPLENELDEDDGRSYHWTAYASVPVKSSDGRQDGQPEDSKRGINSTKMPIGTIRLVLGPHPPHPNGKYYTDVHKDNEMYVKLGRLAVIKEFRKTGISKLLIETAIAFVRDHPYEMMPHIDATSMEQFQQRGIALDFRGLICIHAQTGVQKIWKKFGFETDESMGHWDEEGIDHVGMWKRVDVSSGRRKSKAIISSPPPMK